MPLLKDLDTNSVSNEDWLRVAEAQQITIEANAKSIALGDGLFVRDDSDMAINALFDCGPNVESPTSADLKSRGVRIRF